MLMTQNMTSRAKTAGSAKKEPGGLPQMGFGKNLLGENKEKNFIENLKHQHEMESRFVNDELKHIIDRISAKKEQIRNEIRTIYERAQQSGNVKAYMKKHAVGEMGRKTADKISKELKDYRDMVLDASLLVKNHNGKQRNEKFLRALLPHFQLPKALRGEGQFPLGLMETWLGSCKRKAYHLYYKHLELNTILPSEKEGNAHGRVDRTTREEEFIKHYKIAMYLKKELKQMHHKRMGIEPKKKTHKKKKQAGEHKKKPLPKMTPPKPKSRGGDRAGLTPFPKLLS